jgi:hypothetical protein
MKESTPRFYGNPATGAALPWEWARQRLEAATTYWLTSVGSDYEPHTRPVWGVWVEDRLLLTVGSPIHWRNVRAHPRVEVHLESSREVVVVKGTAQAGIDDATRRQLVALYNPKYDWELVDRYAEAVIAVQPTAVFAWTAEVGDDPESFPAQSAKWVFDSP